MSGSIWHITWEDIGSSSGGLGVACSELVEALPESHVLVSAAGLIEGRESSYSSYYSDSAIAAVDYERALGKLVSGQLLPYAGIDQDVWRFNLALLGLKRGSLEALHVHDWHGILAAVALKRILKIPLVLHFHSTQRERLGGHVNDFISGLEQWGASQSDSLISVSNHAAAKLVRSFSIEPEKVRVVHNSSKFSNRLGNQLCEVRKRRVLFVGRLCEQKAPLFMVEVMRQLYSISNDYSFLFAGSGEELEKLQCVVDFYGFGAAVDWVEHQSHCDVGQYYRDASFVCMTSYQEPFGLVALEAAQMGVPVLVTEQCGVAELLPSAPRFSLERAKSWSDYLHRAHVDAGYYFKICKSLQKEAASYTWQDAAEKVLAIYAKLLD
ncbi:glycosyltransferase family 4 protein [Rubritalea spongiae]|uniref:Glycosyltransferase family 4 protein n=1 Tax=Rubritalea spongiae TaxID=430797 RepID=A0ABW5E3G2_9BACT